MKAISLWQPWAYAVVHLGKLIENRAWKHEPQYRGPLLIHAAQGVGTQAQFTANIDRLLEIVKPPTLEARDALLQGLARRARWPRWEPVADLPRGVLVARARLVEVVRTNDKQHRLSPGCASPCLLCGGYPERYEGGVQWREDCPKADPWAIHGTYGLILANVEPLPKPIPRSGLQRFFEVPDAVLR